MPRALRAAVLPALMLLLALAGSALAGQSLGSQQLLEALWTPQALTADPQERKVGPRGAPDAAPPLRQEPLRALPPLAADMRGNIRAVRLPSGKPWVALTFDLCELADQKSGYDGQVVELLRRAGARATFFAGGKWLRSHPERGLQLMADPRFELGNHGWTHGNLGVMGPEEARNQVQWAQAQYELLREELARRAAAAGLEAEMARVPQSLRLFRLPYGRCSPQSLAMLAGLGLPCVQWTAVAEESATRESPDARARRLAARLGPGSMVLMHANGVPRDTAAVLGPLLAELARRGFELVTVSELLAAGSPVAVDECYFELPGDNLALDAAYGDGTLHPARKRP